MEAEEVLVKIAGAASGKRLFGDGAIPSTFMLVETQLSTTGAVLHVYERAGDLRYGIVEVGQETVIFDSVDGAERASTLRSE